MNETARLLLKRALEAEGRVEELENELADVRSRLRGVLGADPATAVAALGWMTRARRAEELVIEVMRLIDQRSLGTMDLPPGWIARARAQLKAREIAERDIEGLDKPADSGYWERFTDEHGRPGVIIRERQQ